MKKEFLTFLRKILIFSIAITVVAFFVTRMIEPSYRTPALAFIILFFFLATLAFHYLFIRARNKKTAGFINSFMLVTMLKLLLYMVTLLVYVLFINRADAVNFIITFFLFYLLYTGFEMFVLVGEKKE